jgi:hypothetical protein
MVAIGTPSRCIRARVIIIDDEQEAADRYATQAGAPSGLHRRSTGDCPSQMRARVVQHCGLSLTPKPSHAASDLEKGVAVELRVEFAETGHDVVDTFDKRHVAPFDGHGTGFPDQGQYFIVNRGAVLWSVPIHNGLPVDPGTADPLMAFTMASLRTLTLTIVVTYLWNTIVATPVSLLITVIFVTLGLSISLGNSTVSHVSRSRVRAEDGSQLTGGVLSKRL